MPFNSFRRFLNLIYPALCPVCGAPLQEDERCFCTACAYLLPRIRHDSFTDNPACDKLAGKVRFDRAAVWLLYEKDSSVQALFERFKYSGDYRLAQQLGNMAGMSFAAKGFFAGIDVMVPVPLHPGKLAKRGYNQSELIAEGLTDACGVPVDTTSVCRRSPTATQTRKSYWQRQMNVSEIFSLEQPSRLTGKHVLIVDDVLTTGATMSSCARAIWQANPLNVSFLALAMT